MTMASDEGRLKFKITSTKQAPNSNDPSAKKALAVPLFGTLESGIWNLCGSCCLDLVLYLLLLPFLTLSPYT
jgi:hypothetical protein